MVCRIAPALCNKNHKKSINWDIQNIYRSCPKNETVWFYMAVLHPRSRINEWVNSGLTSHQQQGHVESRTRFKVSSARRKKLGIDPVTPGLVVQLVIHYTTATSNAGGMTNSVDPDHTVPVGTVWSGSAMFVYTYLSQYLECFKSNCI